MVITSTTGNRVVRKGSRVRIPPSPPAANCRSQYRNSLWWIAIFLLPERKYSFRQPWPCWSAHSPLLLLFRKKSRSAHLFGCRLPHDGSSSLPTFLRTASIQLPLPVFCGRRGILCPKHQKKPVGNLPHLLEEKFHFRQITPCPGILFPIFGRLKAPLCRKNRCNGVSMRLPGDLHRPLCYLRTNMSRSPRGMTASASASFRSSLPTLKRFAISQRVSPPSA